MSGARRPKAVKRPKFYFSLRSPYSWLAYRDLMEDHPELAARLEWIPFCEPDETSAKLLADAGGSFPYTAMSRAKHLYILQDVKRLAADRGLDFAWPVDRAPWWEPAHLGYWVALRHGKGAEFIARAASARWQEGLDICDPEVIGSFGPALGIDPAELSGAPDDPDARAQGLRALLSVERDGVFGVPFFVRGYDKYWGLDRLPAFAGAVLADPAGADPAGADPAPTTTPDAVTVPSPGSGQALGLPTGSSVDDGHAGGCG
ncbi:2-hydroxychromene-2-carboxylate isomerase [Streptomyces sp. AP-93]|uniref:2-hydroxychromene-2-carboxylate isomerase n=1 Tax=Streptomyces sp. AP-93 TaxID=2929048 RepID=UPI001FB01079|nr:DsbA family protein [Streptomyces sp. AP-93]MCJ0871755.1 DsbA family protein [Streptomyces sp. AP-93]